MSFHSQVTASDVEGLSASAMVRVQLVDINDNKPAFPAPTKLETSLPASAARTGTQVGGLRKGEWEGESEGDCARQRQRPRERAKERASARWPLLRLIQLQFITLHPLQFTTTNHPPFNFNPLSNAGGVGSS